MNREEIKQSVTMPEILARYGIKVRNRMCSCPFHGSDSHPSMQIFSDGFKCHTCGIHGDIFSFVQEYERCDFKTAFQILGGTYEYESQKDRKRKISQYQRQKEDRERSDKAKAEFKYHLARAISGLRIVLKVYEPFSDMWCYAQDQLFYFLNAWEEIFIEGEGVVDLNVYRKCRAAEQYIGIG